MIALDYSISSPAMTFQTWDGYEIHFVTSKKKFAGLDLKRDRFRFVSHFYDARKEGHEDIPRFGNIASFLIRALEENPQQEKIAWFEEYAFGAKGKLANIGECTGIMKHELSNRGFQIKTLSPTTVKKYATGSGGANKEAMGVAFELINKFFVHDLIGCKIEDSPASDVVDSYFVWQCGKFSQNIEN